MVQQNAELDIPTELTVSDTALCMGKDGRQAHIMLRTDKGSVALYMDRAVLERLVYRSVTELADSIARARAKSNS